MTQKELAEKLGVTDRAISKWKNGRGMPELSLMKGVWNSFRDIYRNGRKNCKPRMKELVQRIVRADMPIAVTKDIGHGTDAKAIIIGKEYRF